MNNSALEAERAHLSSLLEAIQRCVYFLDASRRKHVWPLTSEHLACHKKDVLLFESLAAINDRFAKLQDTLGAAMRHAVLLAGERGDTFLRVLTFYEKIGVLDSVPDWQLCRTTRNLAAHDYETDYVQIADHFNSLHALIPGLYENAARFVLCCHDKLDVSPALAEFDDDFTTIVNAQAANKNSAV